MKMKTNDTGQIKKRGGGLKIEFSQKGSVLEQKRRTGIKMRNNTKIYEKCPLKLKIGEKFCFVGPTS